MNIDRVSVTIRRIDSHRRKDSKIPENYGSGSLLRDMGNPQIKENMCIAKLKSCCFLFNLNDNLSMLREKEIKRALLCEIVDFFASNAKHQFGETLLVAAYNMVEVNIFREFPPCEYYNGLDIEGPQSFVEISWSHLELVYQFFLHLLDLKILKSGGDRKIVNRHFVKKVIYLFDSRDAREREYLEKILQKIYYKFLWVRVFIHKQIQNVFSEFIYDGERFFGIAELLSSYLSFLRGFPVPLKQHNIDFVVNLLLPLHKTRSMPLFYKQLSDCILAFISKDLKLFPTVLDYLIRFFPRRNSRIGKYIVWEICLIFPIADTAILSDELLNKFFKFWGSCFEDQYFPISESALLSVRQPWMLRLIRDHYSVAFQAFVPSLYRASISHWSQNIKLITINVIKFLNDMNCTLFRQCVPQLEIGNDNIKSR